MFVCALFTRSKQGTSKAQTSRRVISHSRAEASHVNIDKKFEIRGSELSFPLAISKVVVTIIPAVQVVFPWVVWQFGYVS